MNTSDKCATVLRDYQQQAKAAINDEQGQARQPSS